MNMVIVGASLAGVSAAAELRALDYSGDITLIGSEPHRPYERPPLSKDVLLGKAEPETAFVRDAAWFDEHQIELVTSTTVTDLDRGRKLVSAGERTFHYDRLLLTTGARPRRLPLVDDSGAAVAYLRTMDDSLALRERLHGSILLIGAGWIGLEVAAAARLTGAEVTVAEFAPRVLGNVFDDQLAEVFADLHRSHGVDLKLGTSVQAIQTTNGKATARLSDGSEVEADLVVVGIGAEPGDQLASAAGLATDHGVLVDAALRSSDPNVFAAGDVANHDHPLLGRLRVEHWDTAIHQGRHAAHAMLGDESPYTRQPYFFTDQYDLGMEFVGNIGSGYDEVVIRGELSERVFTAFWIRGDRVVAGMHVNDWDAIKPIRAWVGSAPTAELRDSSISLEELSNP